MRLGSRIRKLERVVNDMVNRWLETLTREELHALIRYTRMDFSEMDTWTAEQLNAAKRGVPLAEVRAMGQEKTPRRRGR